MSANTSKHIAGCLALLATLAACSKKAEAPAAPPAEMVAAKMLEVAQDAEARPAAMGAPMARMRANEAPPPPPAALTTATMAQQLGSSSITFTGGEHKFIRTANLRFGVKDVYVAALGIEDTVGSHGGFVVKNEIGADNVRVESHPAGEGKLVELKTYTLNGHLIVRVPSAKTQEFLRAIASHIVFLDNRNFNARDAQFDLLREHLAQLRNQEAQQELGQALGQGGKLSQVSEAIAARNESKAARDAAHVARKEFDDQVAYSTIDLTLYQPARLLAGERVDEESLYRQHRPGFVSRLGAELRSGWDGFLGLLLGLAGIWPLLLIAAGVATLLWRARRGWKNGGVQRIKAASVPGPDE